MDGIGDYLRLADLVERAEAEKITLPTVQRGFVWKPYQIENLWDSLLRGYPVGAFVMSRKTSVTEEYELLDGQQRASAICLGFHNPLSQSSITSSPAGTYFRTSTERIMVFIDLAIPSSDYDNRKFLFRVITKSHPWGYQKLENQKTLKSEIIAKAMSCYKLNNNDYLRKPLITFWPYDAYQPIPMGLFLHAALNKKSNEELEVSISNWRAVAGFVGSNHRSDDKTQFYSIGDIYSAVQNMLVLQKIPVLHLDMERIYDSAAKRIDIVQIMSEDNLAVNNNMDDSLVADEVIHPNIEDRTIDEIENLFIRLNSGGTPLRGEELNYSILKAHMSCELQKRIEERCSGMFNPARFITIAFRLFNNQDKSRETDKDSITMKIKPKQFQRNIKEKKDIFINFLEDSILDSNILEQCKAILSYNADSNSSGLPTFIVNTLADRAPEIVFMLLYRILVKKDAINDALKVRVVSMVTLFVWLGKGEKQKDHSKLLASIWPCVREFDSETFWSSETIERAMVLDGNGYQILTPFPSYRKLIRLLRKDENIRQLTWQNLTDSNSASEFGNFIGKIFFNKDLILYAQRHALHEWFHEIEGFDLDDTNRAFDWDHISPASAIRNKRNINQALKDWYNSNGNFRAWPYSLNRGDQDSSPRDKLFCDKSEDFEWWCQFSGRKTKRDVNDYLLDASFCEKNWLDLSNEIIKSRIKDSGTAKQITNCILNRNLNLCKEWYNALNIDSLYCNKKSQTEVKNFFRSMLDGRMWQDYKKINDRYEYHLPLDRDNCFLFIGFDIELNTLQENNIEFGFWAYDKLTEQEIALFVNVPDPLADKYLQNGKNVVYGLFTLISYSTMSFISLFSEFSEWLGRFPDQKLQGIALQKFYDSIKTEFGQKIIGKNV